MDKAEVEALAKVLRAARFPGFPAPSQRFWMEIRHDYVVMARAAIAHLSKKRGAKRCQ